MANTNIENKDNYMNNKINFKNLNVRLLCINLVVLVAAFLVNDPVHLFESTYAKSPRLLAFKTKSEVSEVSIRQPNAPQLILKKSDNGWSAQAAGQAMDFPADASHIEKALDNLMDLHKYFEVTSTDKKYQEFEVDDNSLLLELKGSGKNAQLYIGKQGSSFNSTMVRLKGEKVVYSVKGNLKSDWNQNLDYFRNKRLFQFSKENIAEISATGASFYTIKSSDEGKWVLSSAGSIEANPARINRLADDICTLEGMEFNNSPQTGIPYGSIKIQLKSNTGFTLDINRLGNDFLVKSEHNPFWMKIPEYRIKSLFPPMEELKGNSNSKQ